MSRQSEYFRFLDSKAALAFGGCQSIELANWKKKVSKELFQYYLRFTIQRRLDSYPVDFKPKYLNSSENRSLQAEIKKLTGGVINIMKEFLGKYPYIKPYVHSGIFYGSCIYSPHRQSDIDLAIVVTNIDPLDTAIRFTPEFTLMRNTIATMLENVRHTQKHHMGVLGFAQDYNHLAVGEMPILAQPHRIFFEMRNSKHSQLCKFMIAECEKNRRKLESKIPN